MGSWINESIIYHIYPFGFCGAPQFNKDGKAESDITKVLEWIPHLKDLNVNAVYFGPAFESYEHGYDTSDYYKIDSRIGTNEQFKQVCKELHENGIKVVIDGVFNHVGREFWAFRDVREKGQSSPYCGWFYNLNFGGGSPMGDPFWYESWEGHYNLVKLNLGNPDVVNHLLGAVEMWMNEFEIDGLRLDAADCVGMDFFRQLNAFCKSRREDFWLMGEIIHGDYSRWTGPGMLDSITNYECYKGIYSSHNDKNYFEIAHSLNRQFGTGGIYKDIYMYNFVDNHDVNRVASVLKNKEHIYNVYTILFMMTGVPSIYYGSEWGIEGEKKNGSDTPLRPNLNLDEIPSPNNKLCRHISKLASIRLESEAVKYGGRDQVLIKNEQYVFKRFTDSETVYIALNLADIAYTAEFEVASDNVEDVLNGGIFSTENGKLNIEIEPYSSRILKTI